MGKSKKKSEKSKEKDKDEKDKEKKVKKEEKEKGEKPKEKKLEVFKEIAFSESEAFHDAARPFGIELDGALVVDLADESAALTAGVEIGWRVLTVNDASVPE